MVARTVVPGLQIYIDTVAGLSNNRKMLSNGGACGYVPVA
jgi:hypothetical protein